MVNENQCIVPTFRWCIAHDGHIIQVDYANDEVFFAQQSGHDMLEVGKSSTNTKQHACVGKMSIFHAES